MNFRKITSRAGFELVFALGIAAVFALPSVVMAQKTKNLEISISNGDTVVNGKNIKDMTGKERDQALNDIRNITAPRGPMRLRMDERPPRDLNDLNSDNLIIEKKGDQWVMREPGDGPRAEWHIRRNPNGAQDRMFRIERDRDGLNFYTDSSSTPLHVRKRFKDTTFAFHFRKDDDGPSFFDIPEHRGMMFDGGRGGEGFGMRMKRPNSQSFNFDNTDNNGITTHIGFRVFTPEGPRLKRATSVEKSDLDISDLKLIPDFSSGKTLLMFELPAKSAATVELSNSEGKTLWEDKSSGGTFSKSFALPLNGIYYLKVKQGGKTGVKQIVKED